MADRPLCAGSRESALPHPRFLLADTPYLCPRLCGAAFDARGLRGGGKGSGMWDVPDHRPNGPSLGWIAGIDGAMEAG